MSIFMCIYILCSICILSILVTSWLLWDLLMSILGCFCCCCCLWYFGLWFGAFFAFERRQSHQRNVFACLKPQWRQKDFTQVRGSVLYSAVHNSTSFLQMRAAFRSPRCTAEFRPPICCCLEQRAPSDSCHDS